MLGRATVEVDQFVRNQWQRRRRIWALLLTLGLPVCGALAGPLHQAARTGDTVTAKSLLAVGALCDQRENGSGGDTPLFLAAAHGHRDLTALLLAAGARVDSVNTSGRTPLHAAREQVVDLLLSYGADPNAQDSHGLTPLHLAAQRAWIGVGRALLQAGARVDIRDEDGVSPLHDAPPPLAELLVQWGADVNVRDEHGDTPLQRAAVRGDAGTVRLLLSLGAAPSPRDRQGFGPMHGAAMRGNTEVAETLLALGAPVGETDERGRTPLALSQGMGRANPVTALLEVLGQE